MTIQTKTILTGIKPTGTPHIGNYLGMIQPTIELIKKTQYHSYCFIADLHALNSIHDPDLLREYLYEVAATWLAMGIDPAQVTFYRQSAVPEIAELDWILSCITPKSMMNQAHAYKAQVAKNEESGKEDLDDGVNMGLYNYPILMAADILLFSTDLVPIGKDQTQHLEITRDIARRFNLRFGEILTMPQAFLQPDTQIIPGLDGRKMSKSYDNTIPLFLPTEELRKQVNRIKTDSSPPEEPKDPAESTLFHIYQGFATAEQTQLLREKYAQGISWGAVKKELFELMDETLKEPRRLYSELLQDRSAIDAILQQGALRAREKATSFLTKVKQAVGVC